MDLFELKNLTPMLFYQSEPFDSSEYLYELKLDGIRCVAYLDKNTISLRNKRNQEIKNSFPELSLMNQQVRSRVILDGELIILRDGLPSFYEIQKRIIMTNSMKIEYTSKKLPACFIAFDILYLEDRQITEMPLIERKEILNKYIIESEKFTYSRFIFEKGIDFFNLTKAKHLEGVVAKQMQSPYLINRRSRFWVKFKNVKFLDLIICGYFKNERGCIKDLILGGYDNDKIKYMGTLDTRISKDNFNYIFSFIKNNPSKCPFDFFPINTPNVVWIKPSLVCTVKFMEYTEHGMLRHAAFKGLVFNKNIEECIIK